MTQFAGERESEFVALVEKTWERTSEQELRTAKSELIKANQRVFELDHIIKKIYEDNATGRITDEHFDKFYAGYEAEQSSLKAKISCLKEKIETEQENGRKLDHFLELVKKYTDVSELTAEIVRIFIDRIVCHQANGRWGKNRRHRIDIYWNFFGLLEE